MALINREQALSHPFANGQYDKEHADEHFILGFEDYKEWLEDLPTVAVIPKDHVYKAIQEMMKYEHEGFINISLARLDEILKKCGVSEDGNVD